MARNGAVGRQEQHRVVVGGVRRRRQPQSQGTAEGVLPQTRGVHVHAGRRRRPGGRLRRGGRVLLHTDRGPGQRRATERGDRAPTQLFGRRLERHQQVQRVPPEQLDDAGGRRAVALREETGADRQEGLRRQNDPGDVVVLRRPHVLPVHIHNERLRQRGAQDRTGKGRHCCVRRVRHTAVRTLLPQHGKGARYIIIFVIIITFI